MHAYTYSIYVYVYAWWRRRNTSSYVSYVIERFLDRLSTLWKRKTSPSWEPNPNSVRTELAAYQPQTVHYPVDT
jgi:hypothetical protein